MKYAINNATIVDTGSQYHQKKVSLLIRNGRIEKISKKPFDEKKSIEGDALYVSKGWTDLRVHLKDPGFESHEKLEYLLDSAAKGGFTSILTLPNTNPPVQNKDMIHSLRARSVSHVVSILPSAVLSKDAKGEELAELIDLHTAGAVAFTDGDHDIHNSELLGHALLYIQKFNGLLLMHAEDKEVSQNGQMNEGEMSTILGMKGIPNIAESSRVKRDLELLAHYGGRLHFSHISTPESLALIKDAKKKKLNVSCDISVHHLLLDESMLGDYDSNYKLCPPLRSKNDIKAFWKALDDGTIDAIVSDHDAKDEESKNLEYDLADCGIIGLETLFAALYSSGKDKLDLESMIEKLTNGPDRILGRQREGIREGGEADLTVFGLDTSWVYDPETGGGRPKNSPFIGQRFDARVVAVFNKEQAFVNI